MDIELHEITVRELVDGYSDKGDEGVTGFGGKLDIRPAYQREFIYRDAQREAVIDSVMHDFPLNVMYWARRGDGTFEVMDGQQRTISLCQYAAGDFSYDMRFFGNLTDAERERFLGYRLMVYWCDGTDEEKLRWFQTINIAGERLTDQELRNAVYSGPFVTDAKRHFSRMGCAAVKVGIWEYALDGDERHVAAEGARDGGRVDLHVVHRLERVAHEADARAASARYAAATSSLPKWRPTTSRRGATAGGPSQTTASCSAATATAAKARSSIARTWCGSNFPALRSLRS